MSTAHTGAPFPAQLLSWAGNRSGGVRRLFDEQSGRPGVTVFRTNLLARLQQWCADIGASKEGTPRIVLLVGGPGNGKTEAIETTMVWLDGALGCRGALVDALQAAFAPEDGKVPRTIRVAAGSLASPGRPLSLSIVQDASVVAGAGGQTHASLLLQELAAAMAPGASDLATLCRKRPCFQGSQGPSCDACAFCRGLKEEDRDRISNCRSAPAASPLHVD